MVILKTLKELITNATIDITFHNHRCVTFCSYSLRQEAIKWIKEAQKIGDEKNIYLGFQFRQFFNISDDDGDIK